MRNMRVALIGADGQLGSDLMLVFEDINDHRAEMRTPSRYNVTPLYYPDFDITKPESSRDQLSDLKPDVVINTAAYHRVDECEDHPEKSFAVNATAVRDLALTCRELGACLVHFSTDYVFDGRRRIPYTEDVTPHPLSVYGISKLAGEYLVKNTLEDFFLIRTCGLYGRAGCWGKGSNFVDIMIAMDDEGKTIKVVDDQVVTPTSTLELAERVADLIETKLFGLYHMTNEGECTWFEFAAAIFDILGREPKLEAVNSASFGSKARRPAYSVLENRKAKQTGFRGFSHWKVALAEYLKKNHGNSFR